MSIYYNGHIMLWLTMMQRKQSFTFCSRSFSSRGREHIKFYVAHYGSEYFFYDIVQLIAPLITQDRQPTIVDAHFQDGAGRVAPSVLPIKAARHFFVTVCKLSVVWSPSTQYRNSLALLVIYGIVNICWHR